MQTPGVRSSITDHLVISAAVLAILVSSLTLVATLAVTGDLPGFRNAASDAAAVANPGQILPTDGVNIGTGREQSVPRAADRADTIEGNRHQVHISTEPNAGSVDRAKALPEHLRP